MVGIGRPELLESSLSVATPPESASASRSWKARSTDCTPPLARSAPVVDAVSGVATTGVPFAVGEE